MSMKELLLHGYRHVTMPLRSLLRINLERTGKTPSCVLFYHRVSDLSQNDWSIDHETFERQILWLKKRFDLVSLQELQRRQREGSGERMAVSITFDDGYAENCQRAIPFLLDQQVPFTYFVALEFVVKGCPFPHDLALGKPLMPNTPHQIQELVDAGVEIGGHTRTHCDVGSIADHAILYDELIVASRELAERVGKPVRYFAFPYGQVENLSRAAELLARNEGMLGICSAFGAYNFADQDPFHIRRFHADREWARFLNWMTLDPRKCSNGRGFEFPETEMCSETLRKESESGPSIPMELPIMNGAPQSTIL